MDLIDVDVVRLQALQRIIDFLEDPAARGVAMHVAFIVPREPNLGRNRDAGTLPAVRIGRRVRIKRSELDRILESSYQGSSPAASKISGPNATDFWSGEPVGAAEPTPGEQTARKGPESGLATSVDGDPDDHS